ncbi:hypothetical protein [Dyadobacter sp. BHUBP1]|uniref:hypothetical protein n=1 Tax=Dyadobacter sp. BHUBP1 TaxID=3424178 RepID=UPI003D32C696
MLLFVLAVGIFLPVLSAFASRLARGKSFARRKRENLARIKSDLDQLSHAFNNGVLNEEEFEKKSNLLIDELLEQLYKTTNQENG